MGVGKMYYARSVWLKKYRMGERDDQQVRSLYVGMGLVTRRSGSGR